MGLGVDDVLEGAAVPAVLVGLGLAVAAPLIAFGASGPGRPVAKTLIHKYLDMADRLKEMGAETSEQWQDLLAEVHAEREAAAAAHEEVEA
jgi:hypothetical protein